MIKSAQCMPTYKHLLFQTTGFWADLGLQTQTNSKLWSRITRSNNSTQFRQAIMLNQQKCGKTSKNNVAKKRRTAIYTQCPWSIDHLKIHSSKLVGFRHE